MIKWKRQGIFANITPAVPWEAPANGNRPCGKAKIIVVDSGRHKFPSFKRTFSTHIVLPSTSPNSAPEVLI